MFADANVQKAAADAPMSVFGNAARTAAPGAGILVERPVYDEFLEAFTRATQAIKVGDPLSDETEMGPMISVGQRQTSLGYIGIGTGEGARLVAGGEVPDGDGFYLTPAVVADVYNTMRIAREEIFGPVAAILPFDNEDDAIRMSNDSDYGLSGSLWTGSAPAPSASPARCAPAPCRSTPTARCGPRRRSAATRSPASDASSACRPWTPTPRSRTCSSPRRTEIHERRRPLRAGP